MSTVAMRLHDKYLKTKDINGVIKKLDKKRGLSKKDLFGYLYSDKNKAVLEGLKSLPDSKLEESSFSLIKLIENEKIMNQTKVDSKNYMNVGGKNSTIYDEAILENVFIKVAMGMKLENKESEGFASIFKNDYRLVEKIFNSNRITDDIREGFSKAIDKGYVIDFNLSSDSFEMEKLKNIDKSNKNKKSFKIRP